ncbi:MAG: ribosome recycling factor [Zetaproteobacteria bacterium CG_4_9_14_3_um_filter_49_83]|nr:MAG: ribosome recycling factor [Zetaproteobacteria bacterium CG1_02_49_23]PIQ34171.1 MAG: ribosome recycling factor [Zetaproteobacteria bacterium CG17_big_fil_post_rev_8_21_14_2_50_50_13]PIV29442.1 MAG: ribosome recycling factor [Zetaproteobacteria bacterium CG02_land_8_20_14_3_00_50_9]PIY56946.1 MAG: ribosome recycling factor [Zetaproteobacteria bacterium CG_4_10_14_0_8_um_filter_49_80]PJA35343.1 MAG: ribosome recycling factor [Zetaproteobacteria bacterium CG_4_9_14_3_um_filter_49_83]
MSSTIKERMEKSISALKSDLATIRTGRANSALLDHIRVNYYGSDVPVNQVGSISVPEPRILMISPWEKSALKTIEKAIQASDLGLNPSNDGEVIRVILPELTEERRKDLVKQVRQAGEKAKVAIRNIRRDENDHAKKQLQSDGVSEDQVKQMQDEVQKITDHYIVEVDHVIEHKEKDILTV